MDHPSYREYINRASKELKESIDKDYIMNLTDAPIIGYDGDNKEIRQPKGMVYTQAFIICSQCNQPISSHGGPRYNSICMSCYMEEHSKYPK